MSVISCDDMTKITNKDWFKLLKEIDIDISKYYDCDEVIILSAPSEPKQIKAVISDILMKNNDEFCIFCCDIIIDFLVFDEKYVSHKLCEKTEYIYNSLLTINALSIIHIKSGDIFNLPRNIEKLESSNIEIEFMNHQKYLDIIKDCVYKQLLRRFPSKFKLINADWSKKDNFYNIFSVGYRCNDCSIIPCDVVMQKNKKIFLHFTCYQQRCGRKFGWISIPNDKIYPPPKKSKSMCPLITMNIGSNASSLNVNRWALNQEHEYQHTF